jgi:hypothetical protein
MPAQRGGCSVHVTPREVEILDLLAQGFDNAQTTAGRTLLSYFRWRRTFLGASGLAIELKHACHELRLKRHLRRSPECACQGQGD